MPRFHEHLAAKLLALGFNPSKADPDLWYRDKGDHYEYVATYIDDLLIASGAEERVCRGWSKNYLPTTLQACDGNRRKSLECL